jgi:hypothetical protein
VPCCRNLGVKRHLSRDFLKFPCSVPSLLALGPSIQVHCQEVRTHVGAGRVATTPSHRRWTGNHGMASLLSLGKRSGALWTGRVVNDEPHRRIQVGFSRQGKAAHGAVSKRASLEPSKHMPFGQAASCGSSSKIHLNSGGALVHASKFSLKNHPSRRFARALEIGKKILQTR